MKKIIPILICATLVFPLSAATIISDSFNRADSATLGTADVGGTWNASGLEISSNQAIENDGGNYNYASIDYAARTLSSGDATWGFNARLNRSNANPDWSQRGGYGWILAADNSDIFGAANGYAIVSDTATTGYTMKLIYFTGGFSPSDKSTWTSIVTGPDSLMGNQGTFVSARAEYTASTNTWELFADGSGSSFSDPLGTLTSRGTAVDSTFTGNSMTTSAMAWFAPASLSVAEFDNVSFSQIPEPSSIALLGLAGLVVFFLRRRK